LHEQIVAKNVVLRNKNVTAVDPRRSFISIIKLQGQLLAEVNRIMLANLSIMDPKQKA
jgi:hypothetical protein